MPDQNRSPRLSDHLSFGVCAYDDDREFDAERLPHRFVDRAARPWGIGMVVGAILLVLMLAIIFLEETYGGASNAPAEGRTFEIIVATLAVLFAAGGAWLWSRRNVLEITPDHVRVTEQRLLGGETWVAPMSEYRLVLHTYFTKDEDYGPDTQSWTIFLEHERASRTVLLRSRTLLISEGSLKELDGRFADESIASVTEGLLEVSRRWARTLDVPVWIREDFGEPRPA